MPVKNPTPFDLTEKEQARFWAKVNKEGPIPEHMPHLGPCWLWTAGKFDNGYGAFYLHGQNRGSHRIAWIITNGAIPDELSVLHKCDVKNCCRPEHLQVGTQDDNVQDAAAKGRLVSGNQHHFRLRPELVPRGETNGNSRLTEEQVREIRAASRLGESHVSLSVRFEVSDTMISSIVHRRSWKHVL